MGVAMIKGLQFPDRRDRRSRSSPTSSTTWATAAPRTGVNGGTVAGDEAALRALHLAPYQAAVAARVGSVMLSYSSWQGTTMHINKAMITDVLKGELGFGGFVGTDYNGCCADRRELQRRPAACLNAGVDMFMIFGAHDRAAADRDSGTTVQTTIRSLVTTSTVPHVASRRRRPPHPGGEVRDGPVRHRRRRSITAATAGSARPSTGWWRGAPCRSRWSCSRTTATCCRWRRRATVALAGNSADNSGNQCGGWTITWQGMSGDVIHRRDQRPRRDGGGDRRVERRLFGERFDHDRRHRRRRGHRRDAVCGGAGRSDRPDASRPRAVSRRRWR